MQISVRHHTPQRLRVRVQGLRNNRLLGKELDVLLQQCSLPIAHQTKLRSGCLVVTHAPDRALRGELLALLKGYSAAPLATPLPNQPGCECDLVCARCHPAEKPAPSLTRQLVGVTLLTGYVVWVFIRQTILRKPVSENALSLTSGVALVAAIPLFREAWVEMRRGRHKSLFPFLSATCFLAIALGQALTALEVIWILRVGMLLEDYVARRSHRAIRDILELTEKNTFILVDGIEVEVAVDEVKQGDTVVCHTGEKIAVDGTVMRGSALVDESSVNGRSEMAARNADDSVFAGTIIRQGTLFIRAERLGEETYLCRILTMVENALANQAPAEKRADMLADRLMRLGAIAVTGTFVITLSPIRAFTVLLVLACPCATVLAASTAVSAALANAARNHILIKGGYYLEQFGEADCFCFDKTGTLTVETPQVMEIFPRTSRQHPDSLLALAAAAEMHTPHPMARAITHEAEQRGLDIPRHASCEFTIGRGVKAQIDDHSVLVGNDKWMAEHAIDIHYFKGAAAQQLELGHTLVYLARDGKAQALLTVANRVRPKTPAVLDWLRADGVHDMYLVTGDTERLARSLGESFHFRDWRADLLPEEKAAFLHQLEAQNRKVVMVGDGVNDALALADAKIGVAMGAGGAEVAIEAADIALADSDLENLVRLRQLSRKTLRTIEQNHQLAMWTNIGGVVLGAAGVLSPLMAGGLHIIHTLGILFNSSALLRWQAQGLPSPVADITDTESTHD
nr:cation-translocating P-type ATPase [uncultured Desulfuromonas sp.]